MADQLRFIERLGYRDHEIKIARRGNQLVVLIYPPTALLATRRISDDIANYESVIELAKQIADEMILLADETGDMIKAAPQAEEEQ